jgi:RNase P/RNase MRP subunit POP5
MRRRDLVDTLKRRLIAWRVLSNGMHQFSHLESSLINPSNRNFGSTVTIERINGHR